MRLLIRAGTRTSRSFTRGPDSCAAFSLSPAFMAMSGRRWGKGGNRVAHECETAMYEPIEIILYAVIALLAMGAAMVLAVMLINMPSKRARAARRRKY